MLHEGGHRQECLGNGLNQASGEPRESEDMWTSDFIGVKVKYTSKRHEGISSMQLNAIGHREGKKGNLWQRPVLSCWCNWSPGQAALSQFV